MEDRWRGEYRNPRTLPSLLSPRDQGDHHERQSRQRRSSGADDNVKVLPGGKRRHRSHLHDGSPFDVSEDESYLLFMLSHLSSARKRMSQSFTDTKIIALKTHKEHVVIMTAKALQRFHSAS